MKVNIATVLAGIGALISTALEPIFLAYATNEPPQWAKDNPGLVWLIAIVLLVVDVFLVVIAAGGLQKSDPSELDPAVSRVEDILAEIANHPGQSLITSSDLEGILTDSILHANILIKAYNREKWKRGREVKDMRDRCIGLLSRLIAATAKYFSLQGKQSDLIEVAGKTYKIKKGRREWFEAAKMAYQVAIAHIELSRDQECQRWIYKLEKCVKYASGHAKCNELKAMLYDIQGLLFIKSGQEERAKDLLEQALPLALNPSMQSRITFHLAVVEQEKAGGDVIKAMQDFTTALNETDDLIIKLQCYGRLGRIAFGQENFAQASDYFQSQCQLATDYNQLAFLQQARGGLANVLSTKNPPDYKEAYQNASKALKLEEKFRGSSNIHTLHRRAIELADLLLDVRTPPY